MSGDPKRGAQATDPGQETLPLNAPPAPLRPPLPRPERLNRSALTVAAVVMGTLVLAAVVFVQPTHSGGGDAHERTRPPAQPAQGTFLDQAPPLPPAPMTESRGVVPLGDTALRSSSIPANPARETAAGVTMDSPNPYTTAYLASGAAGPRTANARADGYRAALEAPLTSASARPVVAAGDDASSRSNSVASAYGEIASSTATDATSNAAVRSPDAVEASPGTAPAGREQLAATTSPQVMTAFRTSVKPAPGPYAIQAGTVIPAVLVTEINSDLPGQVLAQVAHDVYDSRSLRALLIPKGSRLLGTYADQVGVGQNRLLVAWSRVILPDGRSISLPGLETKDRTGAGGLHDQVDRHGGQVFGTAALLSLIGAGVQLSQPNGGYGALGSYPTAGQVAAGAVGQQLADVATQMLRRDLNVQPTIRIRQGMPFNVFLATDLVFAEPYVPSP